MRTFFGLIGLTLLGTPVAVAQAKADTLPLHVAEKQIDAFNKRDLDAFMSVWAEEGTITEFPSGKVLTTGKAAVRAQFAALMKSSAIQVKVVPRVVNGAFVVDNETWEAKPGERASAVWMYEIRGGLIRRAWAVRM